MSVTWTPAGDYEDIRYELSGDGIAKITIDATGGAQRVPAADGDRADRTRSSARADDTSVGVVDPHRRGPGRVLLGRGPARARRHRATESAARRESGASTSPTCTCRSAGCRSPWWRWSPATRSAAGTCCRSICDLTIAADNARFGQSGPRVGSCDGGFGTSVLRDLVGTKKAQGDLAAVPPVRRRAGARHGPRQRGRPARAPGGHDRRSGAARCSRSRRSRCGS